MNCNQNSDNSVRMPGMQPMPIPAQIPVQGPGPIRVGGDMMGGSMTGGNMMPGGNVAGGSMAGSNLMGGNMPGGNVPGSSRFPVGMGYVPMQGWETPYPIEHGFMRGTIFPSLDYPFVMGRCRGWQR